MGNGGVTLRRRSVMLQIIREIVCSRWQCKIEDLYQHHQTSPSNNQFTREEDTWLAWRVHAMREQYPFRLPPRPVLFDFSAETMAGPDPVFLHKTWEYVNATAMLRLTASVQEWYWPDWESDFKHDPYLPAADLAAIKKRLRKLERGTRSEAHEDEL
jgi:hypothetical protein